MKKSLMKLALVIGIVLAAWQFGQAQAQLASFRIIIQSSASGPELLCTEGCAWKSLSFDCGGKPECKVQVNQYGVGPASTK